MKPEYFYLFYILSFHLHGNESPPIYPIHIFGLESMYFCIFYKLSPTIKPLPYLWQRLRRCMCLFLFLYQYSMICAKMTVCFLYGNRTNINLSAAAFNIPAFAAYPASDEIRLPFNESIAISTFSIMYHSKYLGIDHSLLSSVRTHKRYMISCHAAFGYIYTGYILCITV